MSALEKKWGKNLDDDDYSYLESEYQGWAKSKDVDNKSVDLLIREVCLQQLKMRKAREENGDVDKKDIDILTTLMDKCSITPDKEKESSSCGFAPAFTRPQRKSHRNLHDLQIYYNFITIFTIVLYNFPVQ